MKRRKSNHNIGSEWENRKASAIIFRVLITMMRILFGLGWFLAGYMKIVEKGWFKEPGEFLEKYLLRSAELPNVPEFYCYFIEKFALKHVLLLNYGIPILQMLLGIFLIAGILTIPSVIICLFMHINFILSGNMNLISLVLYTSAFGILLFRDESLEFSVDRLTMNHGKTQFLKAG